MRSIVMEIDPAAFTGFCGTFLPLRLFVVGLPVL
jgi:hypothetical protein